MSMKAGNIKTVAIDGPAGAGKSTLARDLAKHLGLETLDTGAMYRAVALAALQHDIDPAQTDEVAMLANRIAIEIGNQVLLDGADVTSDIRTPIIDTAVSPVAANQQVRTEIVARQRAWVASHGGGVLEGRDIGSVVLPDADLKVYLTADISERAKRRAGERGDPSGAPEVEQQLRRRDRFDSTRAASPLPSPADLPEGTIVVDSTGKSAAQVLKEVIDCL